MENFGILSISAFYSEVSLDFIEVQGYLIFFYKNCFKTSRIAKIDSHFSLRCFDTVNTFILNNCLSYSNGLCYWEVLHRIYIIRGKWLGVSWEGRWTICIRHFFSTLTIISFFFSIPSSHHDVIAFLVNRISDYGTGYSLAMLLPFLPMCNKKRREFYLLRFQFSGFYPPWAFFLIFWSIYSMD